MLLNRPQLFRPLRPLSSPTYGDTLSSLLERPVKSGDLQTSLLEDELSVLRRTVLQHVEVLMSHAVFKLQNSALPFSSSPCP
jgi:hypothetical protein